MQLIIVPCNSTYITMVQQCYRQMDREITSVQRYGALHYVHHAVETFQLIKIIDGSGVTQTALRGLVIIRQVNYTSTFCKAKKL